MYLLVPRLKGLHRMYLENPTEEHELGSASGGRSNSLWLLNGIHTGVLPIYFQQTWGDLSETGCVTSSFHNWTVQLD